MMPDQGRAAPKAGPISNMRALYLLYFMALGAFLPYISLHYERIGLSGVQIGVLSGLILAVTSLTAIPWGALADKLRWHHRILSIAAAIAPVFMLLLARESRYEVMIPIVLGYALFAAPIIPLLDSSAVEIVRESGGTYGQMRVGGTIGWVISVWLVGMLIERNGTSFLFAAYTVSMAGTFLLSLLRPPRRASTEAPSWKNLELLVADPSVLFFLGSIFLVAVGSGGVMSFFSLYLNGIGADEGTIGLAWAIAALSEIPVMLYAGALMRRIGAAGLLKLSFAVYSLRWLLLSITTDPALALASQLLHGITFSGFLTAGVAYMNERTPPGLSTSALAIFNVVSFGLASIAGSLAGGYLYDSAGTAAMLRFFGIVAAGGLALFWLTARRGRVAYAARI